VVQNSRFSKLILLQITSKKQRKQADHSGVEEDLKKDLFTSTEYLNHIMLRFMQLSGGIVVAGIFSHILPMEDTTSNKESRTRRWS